MGLVLDSSVPIAAERSKFPVSELLASIAGIIRAHDAESEFLLSAITWMELEHGYYRAATPELATRRRTWLDEVSSVVPIEPVTRELSSLAAKIDAQTKAAGAVIATADLLIGATALHHGYAIGTPNVRHFRLIPGLQVISL